MPLTDDDDDFSEKDEEVLLEELGEVAHIDEAGEDGAQIVVFASPSETSAIGTEMIKVIGGWLLDRRRRRRERAVSAAGGGQTSLSDPKMAVH